MTDRQIESFFHNYSIRREMALYAETGRPIHAWRAYRWIRQAGLPVPPWFFEYLDECAERFVRMDATSPKDVAEAFGMDRKGRNASISSDQLATAQDVAAVKHIQPDVSNEELFAEVAASRGVSESYVRDAYYRWLPKN